MSYIRSSTITDNLGNEAEVGLFGGLKTSTSNTQISLTFDHPISDRQLITAGSPVAQYNRSLLKVNGTTNDTVQSKKQLRYKTAQTIQTYFTAGFNGTYTSGETYIGLFDQYDGVFLGYKDGDFVCGYRNVFGSATASWDGSNIINPVADVLQVVPPPINVDKITRYRIKFGYLGVGNISYEYFDGSRWVELHTFQTDNSLLDRTHVGSAILPMRSESSHSGCFTISGSWNAQTYGEDTGLQDEPSHVRGSRSDGDDLVIGTPITVVAFRSKTTYGSYPNKVQSRLILAEFWLRAEGVSEIDIYRLPAGTITDGTWLEVNNSVVEYNATTDFNTVTGTPLFSTPVAVPSSGTGVASKDLDFERLGLNASPGDEFVVVVTYRLDGGTSTPERGWNITYEDLF
jgi:hypothetical protein